jgi:hypothetical protein
MPKPIALPEPTAAALLPALIDLFRGRGVDRLPTEEVVAALGARLGRPITANRLARTLKPCGIGPRQFRMQGRRAWGYYARDFAESRDAEPSVESRDAGSERAPDRVGHLDPEQEWATRVAMAAAAMAARAGW